MKYLAYLLLLCLPATACIPKQKSIKVNPYIIEEGEAPWVIAHGGAKLLWPENTFVAFDSAFAMGVDALEMDVCMTKDEVLVTHHNLDIDATADSTGFLTDYTYTELEAFNFGHRFQDLNGNYPYRDELVKLPRLSEVIERYAGIPLIIEIKNKGEDGKRAAVLLKDMLEQADLGEEVVVAAFDDEILTHFYDISNGEILISTSEDKTRTLVLTAITGVDNVYKPKAALTQIPTEGGGFNLTTKRIVNAIHRRNMAVQYWTINDKEEMRELIELGADGLITDRPDLMIELLKEMELR